MCVWALYSACAVCIFFTQVSTQHLCSCHPWFWKGKNWRISRLSPKSDPSMPSVSYALQSEWTLRASMHSHPPPHFTPNLNCLGGITLVNLHFTTRNIIITIKICWVQHRKVISSAAYGALPPKIRLWRPLVRKKKNFCSGTLIFLNKPKRANGKKNKYYYTVYILDVETTAVILLVHPASLMHKNPKDTKKFLVCIP